MIPVIDIRHDLGRLVADLGLMQKEILPAAVRAINRTMTTVRAEAARRMQPNYRGLKVSALKKQMRFQRATRSKAVAWVTFSARRFGLFQNWKTRQTRQGVRVSQLPWALETWDGTRIDIGKLRQAFIQRPGGKSNVYVRIGQQRYPIQGLVVPGLSAAFVQLRIGEALVITARNRFAQAFAQEAKFRLSKRGA